MVITELWMRRRISRCSSPVFFSLLLHRSVVHRTNKEDESRRSQQNGNVAGRATHLGLTWKNTLSATLRPIPLVSSSLTCKTSLVSTRFLIFPSKRVTHVWISAGVERWKPDVRPLSLPYLCWWCDTCLRTSFLSNKAPLMKKLIIYNTENLGGGSLQRLKSLRAFSCVMIPLLSSFWY